MLQPGPPAHATNRDLASPIEALASLTGLIGRQRRVMILCVFAGLMLGALNLLATPPSFTATTLILIDPPKVQILQQQAFQVDAASVSAHVDSQIPVIMSKDIAVVVIGELRLTEKPEFVGSAGWFAWPGAPLREALGLAPPQSERVLTERAFESLERRLDVQRVGLTYVVQISFRSADAELAAQAANVFASTYLEFQQDARREAARRTSEWLQGSLKGLSPQALEAERGVSS